VSASVLLSMTGIGVGEAPLAEGVLRVELRAVNHRHLDVRVRTSHELVDAASSIEDEVRAHCGRGRIEAQARWEARSTSPQNFDSARARGAYRALCELRDELAPGQEIPIAALASISGLFAGGIRFDGEVLAASVRLATRRAADDLAQMRAAEGATLVEDLKRRIDAIRVHAAFVETQRPLIVEATRQKLKKRIDKLLEGSDLTIDAARLAQEVAWFADKSDVTEELTRLESHARQFEKLLAGAGDHVGKKLDFLIQEMGREINTTGAKANDAEIAQRVVEMKAELERLREQVQNVL